MKTSTTLSWFFERGCILCFICHNSLNNQNGVVYIYEKGTEKYANEELFAIKERFL